ncbi:methyltransferase domain-containing protein [Nocardiopsis salina]|uniref:methyltransferase domain-containing protein n=1 Tax=Nocardiopsis salina TaxID=245836 RepID=UPI0003763A85|nr:methyltransferase domain-containing protein [Nocardiopsis salina]
MTARERHSALIEAMVADGTLTDPGLIAAFRAVPRHSFIPDSGASTVRGTALNAAGNPERWLAAVYADNAIITRLDEGGVPRQRGDEATPRTPEAEAATSSSSAPTVLARLLGLADLVYGHRALEIGTGTGWNTALLAHRLGDDSVDSVEIDPRVADNARQALSAEGRSPRITVSDGYAGHPEGAPYDRITSTCGVRALPPAWLEQVAEGGIIVCPWGALEGAGVLARFECPGDGTAQGTFHGGVGFVPLRVPGPQSPPVHDNGQQPDEYRLTQEDPIAPLMSFPSAFALSVMVPDWRVRRRWIGTGSGVWINDGANESWVRVYPYGTSWMIEQGGPRSIWDEFEDALDEWAELGEPGPERFGISVAGDGTHRIRLDSPEARTWDVSPVADV